MTKYIIKYNNIQLNTEITKIDDGECITFGDYSFFQNGVFNTFEQAKQSLIQDLEQQIYKIKDQIYQLLISKES